MHSTGLTLSFILLELRRLQIFAKGVRRAMGVSRRAASCLQFQFGQLGQISQERSQSQIPQQLAPFSCP